MLGGKDFLPISIKQLLLQIHEGNPEDHYQRSCYPLLYLQFG